MATIDGPMALHMHADAVAEDALLVCLLKLNRFNLIRSGKFGINRKMEDLH